MRAGRENTKQQKSVDQSGSSRGRAHLREVTSMSIILVVDDITLCREAISRLLEYEGFTVLRANHGREAWALMYHHAPDLVLLDLKMPEMDGVTLLRMIRGSPRWHELPVIVLTGC